MKGDLLLCIISNNKSPFILIVGNKKVKYVSAII